MLTLLRRIFIKDYKNVEDPKVRTRHGALSAWFGIITNVILSGLKLAFGIIANSISIIGDAINNLTDFASSSVTLVGFKMASKPPDREHPFGHQRIEYIAGLIVSFIIIALAAVLLYESISRIIVGELAEYTVWSFVILGIAIAFKLLQSLFNFRMAKIIKSVTLKATAVDSLTDAVATTLLLVSTLLSKYLGWNIDGYVGILLAIFIIYSGAKMIKETSSPLIGEVASKERIETIRKAIMAYPGVLGTHDIVAHNYGPTKLFMTVHVEVDARASVFASHELLDDIESGIKRDFGVELTCHMDPVDLEDPETKRLKEKAAGIIDGIAKGLMMHDFRVVPGKGHTNVLFDVVVPYGSLYDKHPDRLVNVFMEKMNEGEKTRIVAIIHFDHPFVA